MNKKISLFIIFAFSILILFLNILDEKNNELNKNYLITDGVTRLSQFDIDNNKTLALNGKWTKLINGKVVGYTFISDALLENNSDNMSLEMDILLPKKNEAYGIIIPCLGCNYTIYADNKQLYSNVDSSINYIDSLNIHYFFAEKDRVTITLKPASRIINNPVFPKIKMGKANDIENDYISTLFKDLFFFVFFCAASIYYFIITINDRGKTQYSTFYLICIISAVRVSLMNSKLAGIFFPRIPYDIAESITQIIPCITTMLIVMHIKQLFPKYMPKHAVIINVITNISCALLYLFLYDKYAILIYCYYIIISFYSLLIILITILETIQHRETGYFTFTFAGFILIFSTFVDSYSINISAPTGYTLTIGFSIFVFLHAILFLSQTKADKENEISITVKYNNALSDLHNEETNFLSAHLKPHFLFNALNIISGYALYDGEKAKHITKALSTYLKQLFEHDNLNEMNSLSNEIDLLKAFGFIEYERFPDVSIIYNIDYTHNISIPSLILQPLLENAVNHGIRKKRSTKGTIKISIIEENKFIFFSFIDDGVGFEDEDAIQKAISVPTDNKYHSLYHLQYKLKELYDEKLIIKNFEEEGTYIKFKIPVNEEEQSISLTKC